MTRPPARSEAHLLKRQRKECKTDTFLKGEGTNPYLPNKEASGEDPDLKSTPTNGNESNSLSRSTPRKENPRGNKENR